MNLRPVAYWISVLGGSGLAPKAPGTFGTLASLLLWAPLALTQTTLSTRIEFVLALFLLGLWAVPKSLPVFSKEDPGSIVIDEGVGMGITLLFCPPSWLLILVGFALFRFFDIVNPWPVSLADRKVKGAFGVMLDDVLAGLYALLVLTILHAWF